MKPTALLVEYGGGVSSVEYECKCKEQSDSNQQFKGAPNTDLSGALILSHLPPLLNEM